MNVSAKDCTPVMCDNNARAISINRKRKFFHKGKNGTGEDKIFCDKDTLSLEETRCCGWRKYSTAQTNSASCSMVVEVWRISCCLNVLLLFDKLATTVKVATAGQLRRGDGDGEWWNVDAEAGS